MERAGGKGSILVCSSEPQEEIGRRVLELVEAQHEKARKFLKDNREKLDVLAQFPYLEKEIITSKEFMETLTGREKE